jgi:hypothetical protein
MNQATDTAKRDDKKPRYDLIPREFLQRLAKTFEVGEAHYGRDNWKKGIKDNDFKRDCLNHAIEHLYRSQTDNIEDHFAHAVANLAMLIYFEEVDFS